MEQKEVHLQKNTSIRCRPEHPAEEEVEKEEGKEVVEQVNEGEETKK